VRARWADTSNAVEELGRQGPLASSPRVEVSPSPSCPRLFLPQHLTVALSCGEKEPRVSHRLSLLDLHVVFD
jgi:hypothetical protein